MEEKDGLFILAIVGIIAIVAVLVMVVGNQETFVQPVPDYPVASYQTANAPVISADSNSNVPVFQYQEKALKDSQGNIVNLFIYEGNQSVYEPIVFSMGMYGDHTVTGYTSLKEYGAGNIEAGAYAFKQLPAWAKSTFSSEPDEYALNLAFRQHLVDIGLLTKDYDLAEGQEGSILFFMNDKNEAQDITHESSHAIYNNIPRYESAANEIFDSLSQDKKACMFNFLKYQQFNVNDPHVLRDEATAYMTDGTMNICLGNFTEDINNDSIISPSEQYVWETMQLLR